MNDKYFDEIEKLITDYSYQDKKEIYRAYLLAYNLHKDQYRESGEEYIIHPVEVAKMLINLKADKDTVIAGLLHDVIEDTDMTREKLKEIFNEEVALMVDGVTKLKIKDGDKDTENIKYTRKIITSMNDDLRIPIIKICDKLHNMRTLSYKSREKQIKTARDSLEFFVPLVNYIGLRDIKLELEDLCFKYLDLNKFDEIKKSRDLLEQKDSESLNQMVDVVGELLTEEGIPNYIKVRVKNVYALSKELEKGYSLENIHNLFGLKLVLPDIDSCYISLGKIHGLYHPLNNKFKDFICNPKTNLYRSLHTTVFGPNELCVQFRIRTNEMDEIATFGLASYWDLYGEKAKDVMQDKYRKDIESISYIDSYYEDDSMFIEAVKNELLSDKIHVYTKSGDVIYLPEGSNIVDFAYSDGYDKKISKALVNNVITPLNYKLKNNDTIKLIEDERNPKSKEELLEIANMTRSKIMIKKL